MHEGQALTWELIVCMIRTTWFYFPALMVAGVDNLAPGVRYRVHVRRSLVYYDRLAPEPAQLRYINAGLRTLWEQQRRRDGAVTGRRHLRVVSFDEFPLQIPAQRTGETVIERS